VYFSLISAEQMLFPKIQAEFLSMLHSCVCVCCFQWCSRRQ